MTPVSSDDNCTAKFTWNTPDACSDTTLNLDKYMEMLSKFTAIILIAVGLFTAFSGRKVIGYVIASIVFIAATAILMLFAYNFMGENFKGWQIILIVAVCAALGGVVSYFAHKYHQHFAGMILGAFLCIEILLFGLKMA